MDKVLIFGSTGQLGSDLVEVFGNSGSFEVVPLTHEMADCTDADAVRRAVLHSRPQFVINSAAYVRVDDCEDHTTDAFAVNAIGALNIARACGEIGACCVYISTDYVFDGEKNTPYVESDPTFPINVYGASKLAGELLVRQNAPHWLIVRVSSLFGKTGARGKGGNFIETVIKKAMAGEILHVVNDVTISPTYTRDAAEALAVIIRDGELGRFHVTNSGGECTLYEFANATLECLGLDKIAIPISKNDFPSRAQRPNRSALRSERSTKCLRPWRDAMKMYLVEKGYVNESVIRS